jgi:hypothetical protein
MATFFMIFAVFGGTILICQLVLTLMGAMDVGGDLDADGGDAGFDADHGGDVGFDADHDVGDHDLSHHHAAEFHKLCVGQLF